VKAWYPFGLFLKRKQEKKRGHVPTVRQQDLIKRLNKSLKDIDKSRVLGRKEHEKNGEKKQEEMQE
jgi:hypothetical protein